MRMWQHEDTGVTGEAEKKPGPRWLEVHVVTIALMQANIAMAQSRILLEKVSGR